MKFKDFFSVLSANERQLFAKSVGSSVGHLANCMYGYVPFGPALCLSIERKTRKQVTRAELRPLDAHTIWPDVKPPREGMDDETVNLDARMRVRTQKQRDYAITHPGEVTPPRTHVNTSTVGAYTGNAMGNARPDAGQVSTTGRAD